METLSYVVLILLSLLGYSGGAVGRGGKLADVKPRFLDLVIVLGIWAAAIYSRVNFGINKWLVILLWIVLSAFVGVIAISFRRLPDIDESEGKKSGEVASGLFKSAWEKWKSFSKRMGSFQSRVILSLFFFVIVTPFALAVKLLSDPLRIKRRSDDSFWLSKKEAPADLDEHRRQF